MRVGLTGGLASGKSTVARRLEESGLTVVDADALVADLYRSGRAGSQAVLELFGHHVLTETGAVDHQRLAEHVFADPVALEQLEERIHPLVRKAFAEIASGSNAPAVLEATRLVEAGYAPDFDLLITVEADTETRLARAIERGLTAADARARLAAQGDGELRRRAAHVILDNDGSLHQLLERTDELAREIHARSKPEKLSHPS